MDVFNQVLGHLVFTDRPSARPGRVVIVASLALASPLSAQEAALPPIRIGAGIQSSFVHHEPDDGDGTDHFRLNSLRLYVSGSVTRTIKFMVNTDIDYGGSLGAPNSGQGTEFQVLDAVAQFEISEKFNLWVGRFLPPSDRANLYGPFYAHHWAVYADGVQDGYPFVFQGRDNGAAYWGQFDKVKVSLGAFDGGSATGRSTVIGAGRVQIDFWDPEPGYYLNGTFFGDKNILALGLAAQTQGEGRSAFSVDVLMERKLPGGGAVTVEAEWARYDELGGYDARYLSNEGGYVLAAYLFPNRIGPGRPELLAKHAQARFREGETPDYDQKTTEVNLNYIIKQFDARVMLFLKDTRYDAVRVDDVQVGVGLQLQM
jgi:hypothetical protein